jgi:hypothetical protein
MKADLVKLKEVQPNPFGTYLSMLRFCILPNSHATSGKKNDKKLSGIEHACNASVSCGSPY